MLHDEVRIFEVFSALNLLAWAWALWRYPEILTQPSYEAFATAEPPVWAFVALLVGSACRSRRSWSLTVMPRICASRPWRLRPGCGR